VIVAPAEIAVEAGAHRWSLLARLPMRAPTASLLWLPALGVAARHYLPFAEALAARGVATFVHEWRGHGSSTLRAGRHCDWGYRELLLEDLPASESAVAARLPEAPRLLGGHSLGGQLACCRLALAPETASALWLVASGAPYWRAFPARARWWLPMAYRFLPWLARVRGSLPGRTIGFGGNEAHGLVADWARSGLSGRYTATGLDVDLDAALARVVQPVRAVRFHDDWLGPPGSLKFLMSKMSAATVDTISLDAEALGLRANHFAWLRRPEAVADALVNQGAKPSTRRSGSKSIPVM
jgi:predicted alpha/beta hydrolase